MLSLARRRAAALVTVMSVVGAGLSAPVLAAPDAPVAPSASPASPAPSVEERPLEDQPIAAERSPSPKLPEWLAAPSLRPARRSAAAAGCRVYLVREWLRVRCAGETFALSLVGGDAEGVAFWIDPLTKEGEVLMPLRRGGRHVVQLWKAGKDASGGFVTQPSFLIQEHWIEGAAAPIVTIF